MIGDDYPAQQIRKNDHDDGSGDTNEYTHISLIKKLTVY